MTTDVTMSLSRCWAQQVLELDDNFAPEDKVDACSELTRCLEDQLDTGQSLDPAQRLTCALGRQLSFHNTCVLEFSLTKTIYHSITYIYAGVGSIKTGAAKTVNFSLRDEGIAAELLRIRAEEHLRKFARTNMSLV
ncbi:hypothetical protein Tco_0227992 [Tanacetum coccineum]